MMSHYKQLTIMQRCQIYALKKRHFSQRDIAKDIGCSQSSISRELSRNTGQRSYRYQQAQALTKARRYNACKPTKMNPEFIKKLEQLILDEDWCPEVISGSLLVNEGIQISHQTIYAHIWKNKKQCGTLYLHLRRCGKKYLHRINGKSSKGQIIDRMGIDERPKIVDDKTRIGDWEIDTVIGKGHSGALVTIVERVTKFTVSAQVAHKSAALVTAAAIRLLMPFKEVVHTITADNGKEFAYHKQITAALKAPVYFCHPYCSWERGLNENTNGLIRQYFPKSSNLKLITQSEVQRVVDKLNRRPRKTLKFKTPQSLMNGYLSSIKPLAGDALRI